MRRIMDGQSLNYPDKRELTEDERVQREMSNLKMMFPHKKFEVVGEAGNKRVEVVLPW
jgi:hypothetical protein